MIIDEKPKLMTIAEAADFLGVSVSTIYWLRRTRQIASYKIGKELRFSMAHLNEYLQSVLQEAVRD
jgi:excisionase family DNA binding protein